MKNLTKDRSNTQLINRKDLIQVIRFFRKNLLVISISSVLLYLGGLAYAYRLAPVYSAKSELLMKSNETYDYQDPIYKGLGAYGIYMDVQNQMRIIKSYDLIEEAVSQLNLETSYFIVGKIKKTQVFETLPFRVSLVSCASNFYGIPISVKILDSSNYELTYYVKNKEVSLKGNFNKNLVGDDFELVLNRRYSFDNARMNSIVEPQYEIVFNSQESLVRKFRSALTIKNLEYTSILELRVKDELLPRARMFLDTLMNTYVRYTARTQLEVTVKTIENIEKQLDTVRAFITSKERELINFKNDKSILDIDREEEDFFNKYVSFTEEMRNYKSQIASIKELRSLLRNSDVEMVLPPTFLIESNDFYLSRIIDDIRAKQTELEIMKTEYTDDNPKFVLTMKEMTNLKNDVFGYLDNLENSLRIKIDNVEETANYYSKKIKRIPSSMQGLQNIQRELEVNNAMYVFLLEKKTNTLIARAGVLPPVSIIQRTISEGVIFPNKKRIQLMWLFGGILFGFLIAVIRTFFYDKIENKEMLSQFANLPVIGGIPTVMENMIDSIVLNNSPKSAVAESFRTMRTNVSFMGSNEGASKVILVSSFFPAEGKTFCSTNLADILSRTEKKVLIIDFDLHKPKVHKAFGIDNASGVTNVLIGKDDLISAVKSVPNSRLHVLTAGPIAPNPSELIFSKSTDSLFSDATANYDVVILDTPPFGLLNDAFDIGKYANIFLTVMNTSKATKTGLKKVEEMILTSTEDFISKGLVLNQIKRSRFHYYYSKYSKQYGYSYGYRYGSYGRAYDDE